MLATHPDSPGPHSNTNHTISDHRRLNSSIHQVHHDEGVVQKHNYSQAQNVITKVYSLFFFIISDSTNPRMIRSTMMIWRRNLTGTRTGHTGQGMAPCWTSLRRRSPTSRRAQPPPTRAGPATATSGSPRLTSGQRPRTWTSASRRRPGRRDPCSRWWTRSSPWSRCRWRRWNTRRRTIQAKNVSIVCVCLLIGSRVHRLWPAMNACWHLLSGLEWKYDLSPTLDPCVREGNSWACKCSLNHINIR